MDGCWKVLLFGGLQVEGADRVMTRFRTHKTAALLAHLAFYREQPHSRDFLIEVLWPDDDLDTARVKLRMALAALRRQLEPPGRAAGSVIVADRLSIHLHPAAVNTDVAAFEAALAAAAHTPSTLERITFLTEAAEWYRGELLPGYYEEWIFAERARLAERCLEALRELVRHLEQGRELARALVYARRAVVVDPLREDLHCDVMRLLLALNQPAAAQQQYRELRQTLQEQLGVEPSAITRAFLDRAAGGDAALPSTPVASPSEPPLPQPRLVEAPRPSATPVRILTLLLWEEGEVGTLAGRSDGAGPTSVAGLTERLLSHGGQIVTSRRGTVLAAFGGARDALQCALAEQRAWAAGGGGERDRLPPRLALHIAEMMIEGEQYRGPALAHVEAILLAAHWGQLLCSEETAVFLRRDLEPGVRLIDVGLYRLRGTPAAERLFQVGCAESASAEFPALKAVGGYPARLPFQSTRFFGREEEIGEIVALLFEPGTRLVTLSGSPGTGKTRLSLEAAKALSTTRPTAVWFVPLADLRDAGRLAEAIRDALQLPRSPEAAPLEQVAAECARQPSLLVLDNYEHLVSDGAVVVKELLERSPTLQCLVTSRQRLDLVEEREYPVRPLPTPGEGPGTSVHGQGTRGRRQGLAPSEPRPSPEQLLQFASVQLFTDRAQAVRPDFQITAATGGAVAELCRRLEGIPLALELAAARALVMTPRQMLTRLAQRFEFLAARQRRGEFRQQTLRAALDWSYQLLPSELQRLFARLSVFRGGWTVAAASAIADFGLGRAGVLNEDAQDGEDEASQPHPNQNTQSKIQSPLVSKYLEQLRSASLVMAEGSGEERRYRLLETLREYAWEKLVHSGEAEEVCCRHGRWYLARAEVTGAPEEKCGERPQWDALEREHDNLRAGLAWALEHDAAAAVRAATALAGFWEARGYWNEGRAWLERCLEQDPDAAPAVRARALVAAGYLAWHQTDQAQARELLEGGLRLHRQLGDKRGMAAALLPLISIVGHVDGPAAERPLLEENLAVVRALGDHKEVASSLFCLGRTAAWEGDHAQARALFEESLAIYRERGDRGEVARLLGRLAQVAHAAGDTERAQACYEEQLAILDHLGDEEGVALALPSLGAITLHRGDYARARELAERRLALARQSRDVAAISLALWYIGIAARCQGDYPSAEAIFGERLALCREARYHDGIAGSLFNLGELARTRGEYRRAKALILECAAVFREMKDRSGIAWCLEGLAKVAGYEGRHEVVARMLGASAASFQPGYVPERVPVDQADYERTIAAAHAALGEARFAALWAEGRALSLDEAAALVQP